MVSTYHLVKLLQNSYSRKANQKRYQQPDTNKIKHECSASKIFFETCRVCLQEGAIAIFSKNNMYDFPLSQYLKTICGIDVTADDTFPQYLCKPCLSKLDIAIKLRNTAKESELKLKEISSNQQNISNGFNKKVTEQEYNHYVPTLSLREKQEGSISKPKRPSLNQNEENTRICVEEIMHVEPNLPTQLYKDFIMARETKLAKYYIEIITNENKAVYQCRMCKKIFKKQSRHDHLMTHLPNSAFQYVCDVCGKTFKKYCTFYQHQKIHSNILPYKCSLCPYKGRQKEQLRGHIKRMHMKEYTYQCTLCPEKFLENNSFRRHFVRHSEPKFQCSACPKSFYENSILKRHTEINHMGVTALHKCDTCGNTYARRKYLLKHQIKVHKRKKVFNNRANYLRLENANDLAGV